ncbi:MAG TPA: hypothetical protein VKU19_30350 [Bryobacteraceae bacterium]|nr:hypothetical protein [Bryobacteraceae bacterium]
MFCYSAYNLGIGSEIALSELPLGDSGRDVEVTLMPPGGVVNNRSIQWDDGPPFHAHFAFPKAGKFVVREGRRILITPEPDVDPEYLRMYVQGMMLAAVLHQRGLFVLHSSVVNLNGRAIALIGPVGAGKSSMASAFYARGCPVIADDNAAIEWTGNSPLVLSAFPVLKVYPDVAASLGHDREALSVIHATQRKQAQEVRRSFSTAPVALAGICVLDREAPSDAMQRLSPVESITELIRHSVPARWGVKANGEHLRMCGRLAATVPMYRIRTFTDLNEIPRMVAQIENQFAPRN